MGQVLTPCTSSSSSSSPCHDLERPTPHQVSGWYGVVDSAVVRLSIVLPCVLCGGVG